MSRVDVPNPYSYNFTLEEMTRLDPRKRPCTAGASWSARIRIATEDGVALDVGPVNTSLIGLYIRPRLDVASPIFTRLTSANRTGISPTVKQIVADSNQTTEVLDANGKPVSGKGWITIYFDVGDKAAMLAIAGTNHYVLVVTWASGEEEPVLMGMWEIRRTAKP